MRRDKRWLKPDGSRFSPYEQQRVQAAFRWHVRSPRHPLGRIHREKCHFCARAVVRDWPEPWDQENHLAELPDAEFHHVDYSRPFLGAWLCTSHHRQVDSGSLRLPAKAMYDYSSLVGWKRKTKTIRLLVGPVGRGGDIRLPYEDLDAGGEIFQR